MGDGLIQENAVFLFLVIAQPFAMVRRKHDERRLVQAARLQKIDEFPHQRVAVRNLAVVRVRVLLAIRRRRCVRRVRLVQVEKKEERPLLVPGDPLFGDGQRLGARSLHLPDRCFRSCGDGECCVVVVEAAIDARVFSQDVRRNGRTGGIARAFHAFSECRDVSIQREPDIVAGSVLERQQPGQHRRVRWQRLRAVRERRTVDQAVGRECVDVWHRDRAAVKSQVVRPQRVDRDQHHDAGASV